MTRLRQIVRKHIGINCELIYNQVLLRRLSVADTYDVFAYVVMESSDCAKTTKSMMMLPAIIRGIGLKVCRTSKPMFIPAYILVGSLRQSYTATVSGRKMQNI